MAIAFDSSSTGTKTNNVTSITWGHACTGSNVVLFVSAAAIGTGNAPTVTYNGSSMTQVNTIGSIGAGILRLFYIKIGTGDGASHNVVVSATDGTGSIWGSASSYSGVDQGMVIDANSTNSNTSTSITGTVTTVSDNCWTVAAVQTDASVSTA